MSHYRTSLRDIEFMLFEVLRRDEVLGTGPFADVDSTTARDILTEVDRLAREEIAASYTESDRTPPTRDPDTGDVRLPERFKASYQAFMDAEWWRLQLPEELGGQPAPASLQWAVAELVIGANPAVWMYASGPNFASTVWRNGTPEQQRFAQLMVDRGWPATMVLTEPDAGSDVGAGRTRALPQPDGTWHLEGVKRFITSGEHDLSDNIVHLVLARPVGVEGAGGPGTKGLSMFVVPKYLVDVETGDLGARNGVHATGLEDKMGLKVSTTCELTFGEQTPAVGYLLGDVHDGIAQMFQVIEYARMMVGTKAIATASAGYLAALDYAKERVQGADLTRNADKSAPRVTITHHPDVRRSLMTQKAYAEGMRALVLYTASVQDEIALGESRGTETALLRRVNDLLLPIVKGYGSERSWVMLGTESLQTFGGSGYLRDYPLEQYVRDAKIDTLYEGTTAIQGQDLFFRKILRDKGQALGWLSQQIEESLTAEAGGGGLKVERELLTTAADDVRGIVTAMTGYAAGADPNDDGDPRELYKVGQNTTRLLMAVGDLLLGWLLLRQAAVALDRLEEEPSDRDRDFYAGKVAAAQFFIRQVLPRLTSERVIAETTDNALMDLPETAF